MDKKRVALIGCGAIKIDRYPDNTESEMALAAVKEAILDAGIKKNRIEGIFTTPDLRESIGLQGNLLCEYLRINPKMIVELSCGALAAGLGIYQAIEEIKNGSIQVALCYGASREGSIGWFKNAPPAYDPTALQPYAASIVLSSYAFSARRYMHETGATEEDFARVAVRNRKNSANSPVAVFRDPISIEDVLQSKPLSSPIKMLDSSVSMDGAAAVILASEEVAWETNSDPIYFLGIGRYQDNACMVPTDGCSKSITHFTSTREAARQAFAISGLSPWDVDVAEIYAPFSPHELIIPEDIGWFKDGEMVRAIREGETEINGRIPINTDGGLLSRGHPWSVTPFYQLANLVRQLRGKAGANQVIDAHIGLMHSEGGMLNNGMIILIGRN